VKRILFVDDEPLVLQGLQRLMFSMRREWDIRFANGGSDALRLMAEAPADVVVSDMRMPQMNGAQLLNEIMRTYPRAVRVILSGFSDQEMIMQCVGGTHQFLSKPCDGETLRNVIKRALEMDSWLNNENLKALVSRMGALPSLPSLYFEIMRDLGSPETTLDTIGATIAKDPGMTAKILQLVNSAFFGLRRHLSDPTEAVLQLGLDTIKSLVMGIHIFSEFDTAKSGRLDPDRIWRHSLAVAASARRISRLERQENLVVEEAFTAGLLHDIGRLVLIANLPVEYAEVVTRAEATGTPLMSAERAAFGASHAEIGGYLLGLWGLPVSLVEAVVYHHHPRDCHSPAFSALTAVHAADVFEHERAAGLLPAPQPELDLEYLNALGLAGRIEAWQHQPAPAGEDERS
jgi:HD-like signal output (HDOD) protein/CheY-like chemotaxis protein